MRSNPIVDLHDEIVLNAQVAKNSLPDVELAGWAALGDAPVICKAALSYAHEIGDGKVDVEAVFQKLLGPRRWSILKSAVGRR